MDYFTCYGLLYSFCFLCFFSHVSLFCPIAGSVFTAVLCCRSLLSFFAAVFCCVLCCCCLLLIFAAVSVTSNASWSCRTVHQTSFRIGLPYRICVGLSCSWIWLVYLFHRWFFVLLDCFAGWLVRFGSLARPIRTSSTILSFVRSARIESWSTRSSSSLAAERPLVRPPSTAVCPDDRRRFILDRRRNTHACFRGRRAIATKRAIGDYDIATVGRRSGVMPRVRVVFFCVRACVSAWRSVVLYVHERPI